MKIQVKNLRLYFNKADDSRKAWSIDFGVGTVEMLFEQVSFGVVYGYSQFDPKADDGVKAWLYFTDVEISINERNAVITALSK